MKNNKTVWITVAGSLAVILIISLMISDTKTNRRAANTAIPIDAAVILEIRHPGQIIRLLNEDETGKKLGKLHFFNTLSYNLHLLDSLSETDDLIDDFISRPFTVSIHSIDEFNAGFLYSAEVNEKESIKFINRLENTIDSSFQISKLTYDKILIYKILPESNEMNPYFVSFHEGFLILSKSEILIEKSIRKLNSHVTMNDNEDYQKLYNSVDAGTEIKIFVDYEHLPKVTGSLLDPRLSRDLKYLSDFAGYSGIEFNPAGDTFRLSGYTQTKRSTQYLSVFKNLPAAPHDIRKMFPEKTAFYMIASIGNGVDFYQYYSAYLIEIKHYTNLQKAIGTFKKTYKIDKKDNLYDYFTSEVAYVLEDKRRNGIEHNAYGFLKLKDESLYSGFCDSLIARHSRIKDLEISTYKNSVKTADHTYDYYALPAAVFPTVMFGQIFDHLKPAYYTIQDGYVILAENKQSMIEYLQNLDSDKLIDHNTRLDDFLDDVPDEASISIYVSPYHLQSIAKKYLSSSEKGEASDDWDIWHNTSGIALQFSADSKLGYTNGRLHYEPFMIENTESVWEVTADSTLCRKPDVVINHNSQDKEIIIQDEKNKLYLTDKTGKTLWTRQIDGQILGPIEQIDFYKNNKLQYLFNTATEMHLVDRNGDYVENYPIKFSVKASGPMAIFNYDHDKDYRLCVPFADKTVAMFDKTGQIVDGWTVVKTKGIVKKMPKYFSDKGKDYIVFTDDSRLYITDRKGNIRVKPTAEFQISKNCEIYFEHETARNKARFVADDPTGNVYFVDVSGKVGRVSIDEFSDNHYFAYVDLNGDGLSEFIFSDKHQLFAYNAKKEKLFSYTFPGEISEAPAFYTFSDTDSKIGVNIAEKHQIFLVNNDGSLQKGFPIEGFSPFSITQFLNEKTFSLVVNKRNNMLTKYQLNIK